MLKHLFPEHSIWRYAPIFLPSYTLEQRTHTDKKQGKAKKRAWQKVVDEGITKEEAQTRYVALVEKLKEAHGFDPNKIAENVGGS